MDWPFFIYDWVSFALIMFIVWIFCERRQNATLVDFVWALGIAATVLVWYLSASEIVSRTTVIMWTAVIWAARLSYYLFSNRIYGNKLEDTRYAHIRKVTKNKTKARGAFFVLFQLQAFAVVLFSLPIIAAMNNLTPQWRFIDTLAVLIWLASFIGEACADEQLKNFKANPVNQGKTCNIGLWKYSRHPNYFFEWLHWFAYPLFALGTEYFWWACLGPILMYLFLMKVSGIPYTEAQALRSRSDYAEYQKNTNKFFPWWPR